MWWGWAWAFDPYQREVKQSEEETDDETFNLEPILTQESSVIITGTVREEARSVGGFELGVNSIQINQISEEYPISPKEHGTDFLMNHRHLWIRSKLQHAILRVRHQVIKASRDFFDQNGFIWSKITIFEEFFFFDVSLSLPATSCHLPHVCVPGDTRAVAGATDNSSLSLFQRV